MRDGNRCHVLISGPTQEEANLLTEILLAHQLGAGCLVRQGFASYWWQGGSSVVRRVPDCGLHRHRQQPEIS